ncbi:MAG: sodium-dependent bicarbonate transport family permease, partial [Planctomycetes bacterium]|nr:sodium-dependent bicarbonate transport family permease [Planctomycetota bacterium]
AVGVLLARWAGLSVGGATVLGTMAASASYIAAPPAVRLALPEANPTYSLTAALAITFPFNLVAGIPLYHALATRI